MEKRHTLYLKKRVTVQSVLSIIYLYYLPDMNVIRCFSLLCFGRNIFMPSLRFDCEKCLMKVVSTLSRRLVTYRMA